MPLKLSSLFLISTCLLDFALSGTDSFRWRWICGRDSGLCERTSKPYDFPVQSTTDVYESYKLCRLTCGPHGGLWPKPSVYTSIAESIVPFHPSNILFHRLNYKEKISSYLKEMEKIFFDKVEKECNDCHLKNNNTVAITVHSFSDDTELRHKTNESYRLEINTNGVGEVKVNISAHTIFGVRHGLETLFQLISSNRTQQDEDGDSIILFIVKKAVIIDRPAYCHRGIMIDTSRHYLSLKTIKRTINAMAMNKMNVLHWHATDSQSFPVIFPSVPKLAKYGAYSSVQTYTFSKIEHLLEYAKIRGVRIIMEIDTPAHAGNGWNFGKDAGLGELAVCTNAVPFRQYCMQPPCGQLNPINSNVYTVLGLLYGDIIKSFPKGEFFHMGGDEVSIPCWNSTTEIVNHMEASGMGRNTSDFLKLWAYFQRHALAAYDTYNKQIHNDTNKIIVWSSELTNPKFVEQVLDNKRYIIQTWVDYKNRLPEKLIARGYEVIITTRNAWYLDHGFWGGTKYYSWRKVFGNKISKHKNVLGGEVCMWGEYVDDAAIDSRIWPRGAAAAERLWVNSARDKSIDVESRFYHQRERMVAEGIQAEAVIPEWCVKNEMMCW